MKRIESDFLKKIEYRVDGSYDLKDRKNSGVRSPEVIATSSHYAIVLPATFLARFKKNPDALAAVLLHEVGHIVNKDLLFLFKLRTFLYALILVAVFYLIASLFSSIITDSSSKLELETIYASIIGKSYYASIIGSLILLFTLLPLLKIWREALADKFSIEYSSQKDLNDAELLLLPSEEKHHLRPQVKKRSTAFLMSSGWSFLAGISITVLAVSSSGTFYYLQRFFEASFFASILAEVSYFNLQFFLMVGFYYFITVITLNTPLDR